jgi:hypothetical protein
MVKKSSPVDRLKPGVSTQFRCTVSMASGMYHTCTATPATKPRLWVAVQQLTDDVLGLRTEVIRICHDLAVTSDRASPPSCAYGDPPPPW